ncbi:hypothetical protein [Clostridium sp. C2-6-12]|uniref:hypothetical protein n=1 Tax=Clostridium sp. C2-6-12 TaxID=2698832 RepID=UPI001367D4C7|nr:hypothetical protein [Clostridium sp. C2-6-12]
MGNNKRKAKLIIIYIGGIICSVIAIIEYLNKKNPLEIFVVTIMLILMIVNTIYYQKDIE